MNFPKRAMLSIISESPQPLSKIRLMKLLFLVEQETNAPNKGPFYSFLPYRFGPFSFVAERDLLSLMGCGLVHGNKIHIPQQRQDEAKTLSQGLPSIVASDLRGVVTRYASWSDERLINDVYRRFPSYTVLSERISPPPQREFAQPAVYSIGYEGKSIDQFLRELVEHRMARLIDVRKNPVSRKYGFSKGTLSVLCEKIGVEYHHIPSLGIPASERKTLSDFDSYQTLLDRYETEMLPLQEESIEIVSQLAKGKASALLCFEADVRCCHRGRLADWIARETNLPLNHLGSSDG